MAKQVQTITLDNWQKDVLAEKGNICLCSGRQVGKSTVISMRAGEYAVNNPNKSILVIAAVERQALQLFEKILAYIHDNHKQAIIEKGKKKPTKHELNLKNGSIIRCLPTGETGYGIRGYTIDDLYADEAHFIREPVWSAVTPMLATTGGRINLLSTPDLTKGKDGYFYRCSMDDDFKFFSISTQEVAEHRDEPQRTNMINFIKKEKGRLSGAQFAAEYLGKFVDAMAQFFSNKWIDKVCTLSRNSSEVTPFPSINGRERYLGIDVAGFGDDLSTFESLERRGDNVNQIDHQVTAKTRTTETTQKILDLHNTYNYKKIGIDSGGIGIGVFETLLEHDDTKRKIIALNNAKKVVDYEGSKKILLKEDMYTNLLVMGEKGEIKLFDDPEIKASLRSIHSDPSEEKFKLMGQNSHITEGIIRAAYVAKDKDLNILVYSFKI